MIILKDSFGRVHDYLRISLTDRCNLNCTYCNPASISKQSHHRNEILSFEELLRLIRIFVENFGFKKIRLTGGEPLLRKNISNLFEPLSELKREFGFQLGITTNGILLNKNLSLLKLYGFDNVNISLDSLNVENFENITGSKKYSDVVSAIKYAAMHGFNSLKINTVVMNGINDHEILDFVKFAADNDLLVRFIEYMPFTNNGWDESTFISSNEIKEHIEIIYKLNPVPKLNNSVDNIFEVAGGKGKVGFISSVSDHFCSSCNRLRITSEGKLKLCLFSSFNEDIDLRDMLRHEKYSDLDIIEKISSSVLNKNFKHPEVEVLRKLEKNNMLSIGG